jgi:hypothetical protein
MDAIQMCRAGGLNETGCERSQGQANIEDTASPTNLVAAKPGAQNVVNGGKECTLQVLSISV